jgi:hypothetical protein
MAALALVSAIIWIVTHVEIVDYTKPAKGTPIPVALPSVKKGVAKPKSRLVKCSVGKPSVPMYKRSRRMRIRAQELATSVAQGKQAIAAHMEAMRTGVCTDVHAVDTIIAGVVRDRKKLKKLEYDQPF